MLDILLDEYSIEDVRCINLARRIDFPLEDYNMPYVFILKKEYQIQEFFIIDMRCPSFMDDFRSYVKKLK